MHYFMNDSAFLRFFHSLCGLLISFPFSFFVPAPEAAEDTVGNQPSEDPRTAKFTWKIENFSRITTKKLYSGIYDLGDYKW